MSGSDRYLLLERYGNNKQVAVFDIRLVGKKVTTKWGNKGTKLQKKTVMKKSHNEAMALFNDKRKQKLSDGYRIVKEEDKNGKVTQIPKQNSLSDALPISGKSIQNLNGANAHSANVKSFSFTFGQKQKQKQSQLASTNQKLAKIRQQLQELNTSDGTNPHQQHASQTLTDEEGSASSGPQRNGHVPKKAGKVKKSKNKRNRRRKNKRNGTNTESSVGSSMISGDEEQENRSKTANGYRHTNGHAGRSGGGGQAQFDEKERRKWIEAA